MDPLSDVLSLLKIHDFACRGFEAGNTWAVRFGPSRGLKLFAVISGDGWLAVEGAGEPVRVVAGECLLLASGRPYTVGSDPGIPAAEGMALLADLGPGDIARFGDGNACFGIAGYFDMANEHADLLLSILPPVVQIRQSTDQQLIRWCLTRLRQEFEHPAPGTSLVAQQLATLVLVEALRMHIAFNHRTHAGWLFALADPRIGSSLKAMHQEPGRQWNLGNLARHCGMSRTAFAVRFKKLVGAAPMNYLTNWRMSLARERIVRSADPIKIIAVDLGYESESAFSTAFKRTVGCSPRQYASRDSIGRRAGIDRSSDAVQ